jgi:hypothetical protein
MYFVKLAGVLADRHLTLKGALAAVTRRFHGRSDVWVEKNGVIIWKAKE